MGSPKIARETDSAAAAWPHTGDPRATLAAQFIPAGARVLELGAASLQSHLPLGCAYRNSRVDALSGSLATKADIVVLLGAFAVGPQAAGLLAELARIGRPLLVSARTNDEARFYDLVRLIDRSGFRIQASAPLGDGEMVMRLAPAKKIMPLAPCSVAVLSGNMSFAERLAGQMINALLPGEADVHHVNLGDLGAARNRYDLVVLGTGQGLFHPLFAEQTLALVKSGRVAIGIFGTLDRDVLPRAAFSRLIDRLDVWYARNEDDVLLYGRKRDNVVHLGDWLIGQFPLGQARDSGIFTVGEDTLRDLPLDRAIESIQRHKTVFARSLAPLLCALTTADSVGYADDAATGEFRSLLTDMFGRSYPEHEFFEVDRDAVMRYRARVHRNVVLLRARIDALLRGNAAAAA